jgi:hypothetical protein
MAQSLAFWFDKKENNAPDLPEVELHFNYWSLPNSTYDYLDIGVKLSAETKTAKKDGQTSKSDVPLVQPLSDAFNSLNFYLPFNKDDIEYHYELGELVCREDELIPAIFNGELLSKDVYQTGQYELNISNFSNPLRVITQIQEDQEGSFQGVSISNLQDEPYRGVQLSFPVNLLNLTKRKATTPSDSDKSTNPDLYFRFRIVIKQDKSNPISSKENRKGAFLTGNFERDEIVDFRVNESRNLPGPVRAQLFDNSNIKRVHFFLIRDSSNDLKISHTSYKRCRILENGLWNSYLSLSSINGSPFSSNKALGKLLSRIKRTLHFKSSRPAKISQNARTLIYHWSEKSKEGDCASLDHFAAFSKFTSTRPQFYHLLRFFIAICIIGALGSWLSTLFPSYKEAQRSENCPLKNAKNTIQSGPNMDNMLMMDYMFLNREFLENSPANVHCIERLGPHRR